MGLESLKKIKKDNGNLDIVEEFKRFDEFNIEEKKDEKPVLKKTNSKPIKIKNGGMSYKDFVQIHSLLKEEKLDQKKLIVLLDEKEYQQIRKLKMTDYSMSSVIRILIKGFIESKLFKEIINEET